MRATAITLVVLLLLFVLYVLSYAPVYSRSYTGTWHFTRSVASWEFVYVPVHWLIDETPFSGPLLNWAEVWGVGQEMYWDSMRRQGVIFPQSLTA